MDDILKNGKLDSKTEFLQVHFIPPFDDNVQTYKANERFFINFPTFFHFVGKTAATRCVTKESQPQISRNLGKIYENHIQDEHSRCQHQTIESGCGGKLMENCKEIGAQTENVGQLLTDRFSSDNRQLASKCFNKEWQIFPKFWHKKFMSKI